MSSMRRTVTPTLEASQQGHIDDLVQRNRTLEHTIKKLQERIALEQSRAEDSVSSLQTKWQSEQHEWREACDILQMCHRLVQLRATDELEKERMNVLKEQDITRAEKLARLQRDFKITMFQVTESNLRADLEELEDEKEELLQTHGEQLAVVQEKITELLARIEDQANQLATSEKEKEVLEEELAQLRETSVQNQASSESTTSKLERVTLQLEGAQTKNTELERANSELKRTNTDMQRQLDKWQSLETKGGVEVEALRKQRIELEVEVQALEGKLEKKADEDARRLEKEKVKVKKLASSLEDWQKHSGELEKELEDLKQELANVQRQAEGTEKQLAKSKSSNKKSQRAPSPVPSAETADVEEVEPDNARAGPSKPASKVRSRPPRSKRNKDVEGPAAPEEPMIVEDSEVEEVPKGKGKGKAKTKTTADSDVEEVVPSKLKRKPKSAAVESEVEEVAKTAKGKGKGKAKVVDEDVRRKEVASTATADSDEEAVDAAATAKKAVKKPPGGTKRGRAASVQVQEPADEEVEEARKKKKRKINIFPAVEQTSFNFMPQGTDGGLNIPTALSPVKDSDETSAKSNPLSILGSYLGKFGRR